MTDYEFLDDAQLLEAIGQRSQPALAALYERHSSGVYALAYYVLRNRELAQEVTQDFFVALWNAPGRWDASKGQFTHWMASVARNMAVDRLRHEQRRAPRHLLSYETIAHLLPDIHVDPHDHAHVLRGLLHQLPREQLKVIMMAYFKGMTYEEIAAALNIPHGTVKSRLRLGMQKLRALWLQVEADADAAPRRRHLPKDEG